MTNESEKSAEPAGVAPKSVMSFNQFLETVHPSVAKEVSGLWEWQHTSGRAKHAQFAGPDLRLHCPRCAGERTFRRDVQQYDELKFGVANVRFVMYLCSDCRKDNKTFSLWILLRKDAGRGMVYKYGERPPFGIPMPSEVLRLFGSDSKTFLKGRQCENQGLGIGAFAYYRRVVENHKNDIFEEIIRVCEIVSAPNVLIEDLRNAQSEMSFAKGIEQIKAGLPQGLLIRGHNPLTALHGALSIGLHVETDEECLKAARDVRLVLTDLIEKMSFIRRDNTELHSAVQRLIAKKETPDP
jgi:hypothetical protein